MLAATFVVLWPIPPCAAPGGPCRRHAGGSQGCPPPSAGPLRPPARGSALHSPAGPPARPATRHARVLTHASAPLRRVGKTLTLTLDPARAPLGNAFLTSPLVKRTTARPSGSCSRSVPLAKVTSRRPSPYARSVLPSACTSSCRNGVESVGVPATRSVYILYRRVQARSLGQAPPCAQQSPGCCSGFMKTAHSKPTSTSTQVDTLRRAYIGHVQCKSGRCWAGERAPRPARWHAPAAPAPR